MLHTHDIDTISEKLAYRKHIIDSESETRNVFERETSNENIGNIVTQLDNNQLNLSTDSSKHEETYEPEVNPDPEPSSSDLSYTSSSDSKVKKKKSKNKKKRRKHRKDD